MENRSRGRIPVFNIVNYVVHERVYQDYIRNISDRGLFIESKERFPIGQIIVMSFSDANTPKTIKTKGKIIRNSSNGFAVVFGKYAIKGRKHNKRHAERRNWNRYRVREGIFAIINERDPYLSIVTDISEDGIGIEYPANLSILKKDRELIDIFSIDPGYRIRDLLVKPKWEVKLSMNRRKKGIHFYHLTANQRSHLNTFINLCDLKEIAV